MGGCGGEGGERPDGDDGNGVRGFGVENLEGFKMGRGRGGGKEGTMRGAGVRFGGGDGG